MKILKECFKTPEQETFASASLLLLRFIMGAAFVIHGWGKMQSPLNWMGPESPVPGIFQLLASMAEFGGGIALIMGLLVPLASIGIACTMAGAVYMHALVNKDPFVGTGGPAYELALVYFGVAIMFLTVGPGKISLDYKIFGARKVK
jgi:putative oxidoreductase